MKAQRLSGSILTPQGFVAGELSFDYRGTDPIAELGDDAEVAVSGAGTIFATAPSDGELLALRRDATEPERREMPRLGDHQPT